MTQSITEIKREACEAGRAAAKELLKIAREPIIMGSSSDSDVDEDGHPKHPDTDLSADKLTRAAQAKKICIMDAFDILERVDREELALLSLESDAPKIPDNFSEARAKRNNAC